MKTTVIVLLSLLLYHTSVFAVTANFSVEPGTAVEVGEEVFFNAINTTYNPPYDPITNPFPLINAIFEWDFGDGYSLKWRIEDDYMTGVAVTHYFMTPGTYTVTLTVHKGESEEDFNITSTATKTITVSGEKPVSGFEVRHAPFNNRISQYCYIQIPETYQSNSTTMVVTLTGNKGYSKILFNAGNLHAEEIVLLEQGHLLHDDYVLSAELFDGGNNHISIIREKFNKPSDAIPTISIDKNNSLVRNGKLFFPVQAWFLHRSFIADYKKGGFINSLYMQGYHYGYNLDSWKDYVENWAKKYDLPVIGEDRWHGKWGVPPQPDDKKHKNLRNSDINILKTYVNEVKNSTGILAWCMEDEPNMGGRYKMVHAPTLSAWDYVVKKEDFTHPTVFNAYRYDQLPWKRLKTPYYYLYSENAFGGKKDFHSDILHGPMFVYAYGKKNYFKDPSDPLKGPMSCYTEGLDTGYEYNYNLIPHMDFVCPTVLRFNPIENYLPDPMEIRLTSWLPVIHGSKGISWFPINGPIPPENFGAMAEFAAQTTELTDVILGPNHPEITLTDNANEYGNKVDTLVREHNGDIYIFAARVTEPPFFTAISEPETINVQFTLQGVETTDKILTEYNNHHRTWKYMGGAAQSSFNLTLSNLPVTPNSLVLGGRESSGAWHILFDDGQGNLFRNRDYQSGGGTMPAGTINYQTGEINCTFINPYTGAPVTVAQGLENVSVAYVGINPSRNITVNNGHFSDTFTKNSVHIYRLIPNIQSPSGLKLLKTE